MSRPNILFILTDHFRRDCVGKSTPNISRLADSGVTFENAYCAAPLCSPSRCSIITGLFPSQHGVCGNQSPPISNALRDETYMNRLQRVGYQTALSGKHHWIDRYGVGMNLQTDAPEIRRYGLETVIQVVDDGENTHNDDDYTAHLKSKGLYDEFRRVFPDRAWQCKPHPFESDDTVDGFIGSKCVEYIEALSGDRPFYLQASFVGPHPPFWHPGELVHDPDALDDPIGAAFSANDKLMKAHFMDRCTLIDEYIGRMLEALRRKGLLDSTLVVFSSDHGENAGDFGIWDKRFCYEQSWGVPLIMSGPGVAGGERGNGKRVSKALVSHLDLYPTFLAIAGIEADTGWRRWGRNLMPLLANRPASGHAMVHAELGTAHLARNGNWKVVFDPEAGGVQYLFNLAIDPFELKNLAGVPGYEVITARLLEDILSHRIRLTNFTHVKEEQRVQRVRIFQS